MGIDLGGLEPVTYGDGGLYLDDGDHEVTIAAIEFQRAKSNKPMVVVEYENSAGQQRREYLAYGFEFGNRKLATLIQSTGADMPEDDDWDDDELDKRYLRRLKGKKLGIHVRTEDGDDYPSVVGHYESGSKPEQKIEKPNRDKDAFDAAQSKPAEGQGGFSDDDIPF